MELVFGRRQRINGLVHTSNYQLLGWEKAASWWRYYIFQLVKLHLLLMTKLGLPGGYNHPNVARAYCYFTSIAVRHHMTMFCTLIFRFFS
jgi:hypothetical protein